MLPARMDEVDERKPLTNSDFSIRINGIYNMDCLEGMRLIPSGSVDLILSDLPYGMTQNSWDSIIPLDTLWQHYNRIIKLTGVVVLTAQGRFVGDLMNSNKAWYKHEWIWEKTNASGFLNAKRRPLTAHENCLVFTEGRNTYNPQMTLGAPYTARRKPTASKNFGKCTKESEIVSVGPRYPRTVLRFPHDREHLHPTQKPVALFEYFIRTYTNPGETVLDNCIGSGTTAIAAINAGRSYLGFELDPDYFQVAQDRIAKHKASLKDAAEAQASWECAMRIDDPAVITDERERRYDLFRERILALAANERAA